MSDHALREFERHLARAFDEDAIGSVHGYRRTETGPELVHIVDQNDPRLLDRSAFEMIVIDSGNSAGDSWKHVYHPLAMQGITFTETGL